MHCQDKIIHLSCSHQSTFWGECRSPSKSLDHSLPHSIYADSPEAAFFAAAFAMVGQAKLHLFFIVVVLGAQSAWCTLGNHISLTTKRQHFPQEVRFLSSSVLRSYIVIFLCIFSTDVCERNPCSVMAPRWTTDREKTPKIFESHASFWVSSCKEAWDSKNCFNFPKFSNPMLPCSLKPKRISTIKNLFFPWFSHRLKKSNRSELSFVSTAGSIVALCDLAQWFVRFADRFIWLEK